jgi:protein-disulfide isomerase
MDARTRRRFLGTAGGLLAGLAGCLGGDTGGGSSDGATRTAELAGESADVTFDHESAAGINDQPTLGDRDWQGVIVAFEDPSCPTCRRFHRNTFPQIRSDLVATGDVAYVLRGYPVVYEWGGPATQALEAVSDRDPAAVWDLAAHYFDQQDQFSTDNVLDQTREFLNGRTEVDGDAVVADVGSDAYADAVQTDLDAGQAAGASGTPTFYLFGDGEYQTTVSGAQDFTVFENVLTG